MPSRSRRTIGERRLPAVKPVLTPLSPRRQAVGLGHRRSSACPLLAAAVRQRPRHVRAADACCSLYLVLAMVVALVGGVLPAAAAVIGGFLLANCCFTPPYYTLDHPDPARTSSPWSSTSSPPASSPCSSTGRAAVGCEAARRTSRGRGAGGARRVAGPARRRSPRCSTSSASPSGSGPPPSSSAATGRWHVQVASGHGAAGATPTTPTSRRDLGGGITLALAGGALSAEDQRVLNAFAAQVAAAAERERLHAEAGKASRAGRGQRRCAASLLQAVSHDLRTPLASIKASISSLRQRRHRLAAGRRRGVRGDDRERDRPPDQPRRQPARHEPAAGVGAHGATLRPTVRRRGRAGRHRQPRHRACPTST